MEKTLSLRPVRREDSRLLWTWANDPTVRAVSFSSDAIPWETHEAWFERKLRDDRCRILVAESEDGSPLGVVRFEATTPDQAVISVSLDQSRRNAGLGTRLLELGVDEYFRSEPVDVIDALIKVDNIASRRAFEKAGFAFVREETFNGQPAARYVRMRNVAESGSR